MNNDDELISFNNKKEAEILLKTSRECIDEIDNKLFDLIYQRTSIARNIFLSKEYLNMPIYDKQREDMIHEKIENFSNEKGMDVDIINQIVDMLTILSKNEQKKFLRRNDGG